MSSNNIVVKALTEQEVTDYFKGVAGHVIRFGSEVELKAGRGYTGWPVVDYNYCTSGVRSERIN